MQKVGSGEVKKPKGNESSGESTAYKASGDGDRSGPLPDLDLRRKPGKEAESPVSSSQVRAAARLKGQIPGVAVDFDPISQSPKWVGSATRLLGVQPGAGLDADAPIRQFLEEHRDLFGHGAEALEQARRVTDYSTSASGSRKVVWHQQLEGIDIFEAVFQANLTAGAVLINIGSQLLANPSAAAGDHRARQVAAPAITVEEAVALAGQNVGEKTTAASVRPLGPPAPRADRRQPFRAAMLTDAEAGLVWVPMDATTLRLAWDVTLTSRVRGEMYRVLVDAETRAVLVRQALTSYNTEAGYRVFTTESPSPMSPGHETVSSLQPALVERVLVTTAALVPAASPAGWLPAGEVVTSGNNVDAYADANADNVADLPRATASSGRVFDFPMDLTREPWTYQDASVTQLFYWTNFAHDRLYELGFTEAAGNFQLDNFGRGGEGNDPVNAEAQDGAGTNNANFSTPVDGGRGRMQMFNWTAPTPDRDGSFEAEIVLHEYAHGLSNRLVGGPSVTITALSSRGLGEGWSDFYGMALTADAAGNPQGNMARGGYTRYQNSGWFSENYYYGARRYSYSPDMGKNPHTFRDIDPTQVDWHEEVPRNPTHTAAQDATQTHYQGTVWCTMLWEMRANLVMKHGFATGNQRALFLVTEGMKLGPANPNFVQARDGIIQAALVSHPQDLGDVWAAFAKRGLGLGATAPASTTTTGVTESYRVPDSLAVADRSGWNITGSRGGPFAPAVRNLTLRNEGSAPVVWKAASTVGWLNASPGGGTLLPGAEVGVTVSVQAAAQKAGFHSGQVVVENTGTGFRQPVAVRLHVAPPVVQSFNLDKAPAGWTTTGEWDHGAPTGGGGAPAGGSGQADPVSGATGVNVYGVNLSGNHSSTPAGPFYLTSAALDFTAYKSARLRFKRWLNAPGLTNNRITVEVRSAGAPWREVYVNGITETTDGQWQPMDYDIASLADGRDGVQVRWGYQPLGNAGNYAGWNVDDIQFLAEPQAEFTLTLAASVAENAAPITGTVILNTPRQEAVTVTLTSGDSTAAVVPATVLLAPGQVSRTFSLQPVDDVLLDGTQNVVITASAPGIAPGHKTVAVTDNESAQLVLTAPASVAEGAAPVTGQLRVSSPPAQDVQVMLASSSAGVVVPVVVTLPAGSTAPVSWTLATPDNAWADGSQSVRMLAFVPGWSSGECVVTLTDNDQPTLLLQGADSTTEGEGTITLTATVNTRHSVNLQMQLSSSDESELTVPATITLPAGQTQVPVVVTVVDDGLRDGWQQAGISGSIVGYAPAARAVRVMDNDVDHYRFGPVGAVQKRGKPFELTVTAHDVQGHVITGHGGGLTFGSTSAAGAVPLEVASLYPFSQGVAAASVAVTAASPAMTLTVTDAQGRSGSSAVFAVEGVSHDGFTWSGLPGWATADTAFTGTATAVDDLGTAVPDYRESTVVDTWMATLSRTVGPTIGAANTAHVFNTTAPDSRAQLLYTAEELGAFARWLGQLEFSLYSSSSQLVKSFTIRLKHTDRDSFAGASWEEGGWTTVYSNPAFATAGSSRPNFARPFFYNGVQNLMVDISFKGSSTSSSPATVRSSPVATARMLSGTSTGLHGDPLTWTAASGPVPVISQDLPTLLLYEMHNIGPVPDSPLAFTAGAASVQAFAPLTPTNVIWLRARSPSGVVGFSPPVLVNTATAQAGADLVFFDGFETGSLGPQWSTADSSPTARARVTGTNTPYQGGYHLILDAPTAETGTFVRNSPTLTVDLAGRKNVSVEWYAKEYADESHPPAPQGPLGTFGSAENFDGVAISQDGVTWHEIATLTELPFWSYPFTRVNLDPVLQQLGWTYNASFKIRFSQYDDQEATSDGIAVDNIAIRANWAEAIGLALPPVILEGSMNVPVEVSLPTPAAVDTPVNLISRAIPRLQITTPVIIPAGQRTATAYLSAPQNQLAEVARSVSIGVSATGRISGQYHIRVQDDEAIPLGLDAPASLLEGNPPARAIVRLPAALPVALPVYLVSSRPDQLTVQPSQVIIPAGKTEAEFAIAAVDDAFMNGSHEVGLTASANGPLPAVATVVVVDNEPTQIVMTEPLPVREAGEGAGITLTISGARAEATVVTLTSSDPGEAAVPASVVIPAGQTSAVFEVAPVDDLARDGEQTVIISADYEGLLTGSVAVQVLDDEPAHLAVQAIASPQVQGADIPLALTAQDETGALIPYQGTVLITARSGAQEVPVLPAGPVAFVQGVWQGAVRLGAARGEVVLVFTTPGGMVFTSAAFDVNPAGAPGGLTAPVPQLNAEPLFTAGAANHLSWPQPPAGVEICVEAASDAAFTQPQASTWVAGAGCTFTGLVDGETYYYRARSRVLATPATPQAGPEFLYSASSPVVSSTQDATPPVLELLTPVIRHLSGSSAELSGLAGDAGSGLASVTVNGQPALSINGYASWHRAFTALQGGAHVFTITAADRASPPNVTTVTSRLYCITTPAGDGNGNGVADLLDHALGSLPVITQGPALGAPALQEKSLTGSEACLILTYHRYIDRGGLHYAVETSENLTHWDASGQDVVEESVLPDAGGLMETVRVRVLPGPGGHRAKFVRVQVGLD